MMRREARTPAARRTTTRNATWHSGAPSAIRRADIAPSPGHARWPAGHRRRPVPARGHCGRMSAADAKMGGYVHPTQQQRTR